MAIQLLDVTPFTHHSLGLAIQPVYYPLSSALICAMGSQFLQENAAGDSFKSFTKVQVNNTQSRDVGLDGPLVELSNLGPSVTVK